MFNRSLLPASMHSYGAVTHQSTRDVEAAHDINLHPKSGLSSRSSSTFSSSKLKLTDFERNKEIFDSIWNDTSVKSNWLMELGKKEGLEFGAQFASSVVVTAAIYFVSTTILSKSGDAVSLLANADNPDWVSKHIFNILSDPQAQKDLVGYLTTAAAAGGVANNLVLTQAVTGALTRMGEPISALLKALVVPQQGADHQAKIKQTAFRRMSEKVEPLRVMLPDDRRERFDSAFEELRGQIDGIGRSAFAPDYNQIKKLFDRLYLHLSYPIAMKDTYQLGINGDPVKAKDIQSAQDELTKSFHNEELTDKLNSLFTLARYSTVNPQVGPVIAFFDGPPSTGKTWVANQAGKNFLNSRVVKMSIEEFLIHTGVRKAQQKYGTYQDPDLEVIPEPHKGRITDADSLNEIILIDEVKFKDDGDPPNHLHLMEELKQALTIDPSEYPSVERLRIRANAMPMIVICTNHGFDFVKNKALGSRFTASIKFPNWSKEAYGERISQYIDLVVSDMARLHKPGVIVAMDKIFKEIHPFIMKELERHDSFRDDAKLFLREVHIALKREVAGLATQLDQAAAHSSADLIPLINELQEKSKENIRRYFQDVVDQYDSAAAKDVAPEKPSAVSETAEQLRNRMQDQINALESNLSQKIKDSGKAYSLILEAAFPPLGKVGAVTSAAQHQYSMGLTRRLRASSH